VRTGGAGSYNAAVQAFLPPEGSLPEQARRTSGAASQESVVETKKSRSMPGQDAYIYNPISWGPAMLVLMISDVMDGVDGRQFDGLAG
jgi:hypothetical protein